MKTTRIVSPQAKQVFDVLCDSERPMSAEQIAKQLHILPNAVYRSIQQLIQIGIVNRLPGYPVTFRAVDPAAALPWYLLDAQKVFREVFNVSHSLTASKTPKTSLAIVRNRDDFLRKVNQDAGQAKHTVDFIVSGLEVPDDTILTYRGAVSRGIRVRALLQERHETSKGRLEDWQSLGAKIRYASYLGLRLFVIDNKITYLVSYSQSNAQQALGVRYDYAPLAITMASFFETQWQMATP